MAVPVMYYAAHRRLEPPTAAAPDRMAAAG
jgi:hypothetical protein